MLRRAHAHRIRWTLGRLRHSMLCRYSLGTEVPPLWSFEIVHNVLTNKQLYSWRLLRWEPLAALLDMGKDVQVEQKLSAGSSAAASCWSDPAEMGTHTEQHSLGATLVCTAQHSLKALQDVQHSTVQLCACSCKLWCGSPAPLPKASGFPGRINAPTDRGVTSTCCLFFLLCVQLCICIHTWFILVPIFLFLCNATFVCCPQQYSGKFCLFHSLFFSPFLSKKVREVVYFKKLLAIRESTRLGYQTGGHETQCSDWFYKILFWTWTDRGVLRQSLRNPRFF